ncbi:MAG: thiamine phosphate synthase [Hyphomonadaceae bacterium]|nr:thiamine phosphate synthase [Hyphomonadaceae bacterium]
MARSPSPVDLLARAGRRLQRRHPGPSDLPALLFLTDPTRTPDPAAVVRGLPRGAGVIYRHFGAADRLAQARALLRICRRRGLVLLLGADAELARRIGADGVHVPERLWRKGRPPGLRLITCAAHGPAALRSAALRKADAALLSPVFPSRSPSAQRALGLRAARALAAGSAGRVYALGGVRPERLPVGRFCGIAAIEALAGR